MNKKELMAAIGELPDVSAIVNVKQIAQNEQGDKTLEINLRMVKEDIVKYKNIYVSVCYEGTQGEQAFFIGTKNIHIDMDFNYSGLI